MSYQKILVVSNMYPSREATTYGIFIKNFCAQLDFLGIDYRISVLSKTHNQTVKFIKYVVFYLNTFLKCMFGKYDLVYIHFPSFSAPAVLIARKIRSFEVISNVHGEDVIPNTSIQKRMLRFSRKAFDISRIIVSPSVYFKRYLINNFLIEEEKIAVYPSGGVNEKVFFPYSQEERNVIRKELGIGSDCFIIGYVSRIEQGKGWEVLLDALEKCLVMNSGNCKVIIVGSGSEDGALQYRIHNLPEHLRSSIIKLPLLDQTLLPRIYNIFDIFVFPTMRAAESLGLVALEAMSCGVPVIASDFAAPSYFVEEGVNGFKYEPGNSVDLAKKIDRYAMNKASYDLVNGAQETAKIYSAGNAIKVLRYILEC